MIDVVRQTLDRLEAGSPGKARVVIDEYGDVEVAPGAAIRFRTVGPVNGVPLMLGLPLMSSHTDIFGPESAATVDGYLERLTDAYRVLLVDYPEHRGQHLAAAERDDGPARLLGSAGDRRRRRLPGTSSTGRTRGAPPPAFNWPPAAIACRPWWSAAGRPWVVSMRTFSGPRAARSTIHRSRPGSCSANRPSTPNGATFYESVLDWPEQQAVAEIDCPRMVFFGGSGDVDPGGEDIRIASTLRERWDELERLGWAVHEFAGRDHSVCLDPGTVVPPVRAFLDEALSRAASDER